MADVPKTYTPSQVIQMGNLTRKLEDGRWVPARSISIQSIALFRRFKAAWLVFTGRCDVLKWEG